MIANAEDLPKATHRGLGLVPQTLQYLPNRMISFLCQTPQRLNSDVAFMAIVRFFKLSFLLLRQSLFLLLFSSNVSSGLEDCSGNRCNNLSIFLKFCFDVIQA